MRNGENIVLVAKLSPEKIENARNQIYAFHNQNTLHCIKDRDLIERKFGWLCDVGNILEIQHLNSLIEATKHQYDKYYGEKIGDQELLENVYGIKTNTLDLKDDFMVVYVQPECIATKEYIKTHFNVVYCGDHKDATK